MSGAGSAGRKADSDFAGELGVRNRHERGHLLMPDLHELDGAGALQAAEHAVDAVARVAEDSPDAPLVQPLHDEIADFHGAALGSNAHQPGCSA